MTDAHDIKDVKTSSVMIGKALDYQAKQICYNVYSYFKQRKQDRSTQEYRDDINLINTVSLVTGLSKTTVTKIAREGNELVAETSSCVFTPQDKKKQVRKKRIEIDKFTEGAIRRKVLKFATAQKDLPSLSKFNQLLKEENIITCSHEYLRQLLQKLGFTKSEGGLTKGMILERPDIIDERFNYLQAISEYRAQNKSIFFLNETRRWLETAFNISNTLKMPSIIIVHASGSVGFKDGSLIMLKPPPKNSYENDTTFELFDNYDWMKDRVMLNLPPSSVVVMNTPCDINTAEEQDRPISSSTREAMEEWLDRHRIPYNASDSKSELLQLINNEQKAKEYSFAKMLEENGHTVLNLPQNHLDLDPVVMTWDEYKNGLEEIPPLTLFSKYSTEDWAKCFDRLKEIENEYYEHDVKYNEIVKDVDVNCKEDNLNIDCDNDMLDYLL